MALKLFKLVISAETATTVLTNPDVRRFFYEYDPADFDPVEEKLIIPAGSFVDDEGNPVVNIPLADPDNGYYLLFINGVLQQADFYTVSAGQVEVEIGAPEEIQEGEPIILVVTNFEPDADSTTTIIT
ncbi:MAG TPA: DUF4183 domain-containing protein [Clostridiales bacterium]|nr:DUF4183 domain-containing protein [Clostridiales bacterium]